MTEAPERVWVDFFDEPTGSWCGDAFATDSGDVEYIRADVSAARIADLERQLAEARDKALEEAAVAGGDAAVEVLFRQEPDASQLKVQMTRQAIAKAIRNLKGTP